MGDLRLSPCGARFLNYAPTIRIAREIPSAPAYPVLMLHDVIQSIHNHVSRPRPLASMVAFQTCGFAGYLGAHWWTLLPLTLGCTAAEYHRLYLQFRARGSRLAFTWPLFLSGGLFAAVGFSMGRLIAYFLA